MKKIRFLITVIITGLFMFVLTLSASALVVPIDSMDDASPWAGGVADNTSQLEGSGCVACASSSLVLINRNFESPLDLSALNNGYLHIRIYIRNAAATHSDGQIELTSSGGCDNQELGWSIGKYVLKDGWNELYLPVELSEHSKADLTCINFSRIYMHCNADNLMMVDCMEVVAGEEYEAVAAAAATQYEADYKLWLGHLEDAADIELQKKADEASRVLEKRERESLEAAEESERQAEESARLAEESRKAAQTDEPTDFETDENGNVVDNNPIYGGIEGGSAVSDEEYHSQALLYLIITAASGLSLGAILLLLVLPKKH